MRKPEKFDHLHLGLSLYSTFKIMQNSQENTNAGVSFLIKLQGLQLC